MRAKYVPPVRTPAEPLDVSRGYRDALTALTGIVPAPEAVAVLHSHYDLETGRGVSCWNNNPGNIKAGVNYEGLFTCITLNERLKQTDGSMQLVWFRPEGRVAPGHGPTGPIDGATYTVPDGHPQTQLRAYETFAKGLADKIAFLMKSHWRPALDLALNGQPGPYARKLHDLGYYTAEPGPYARGLMSLYQKNLPIARGVANEPKPLTTELEEQLDSDIEQCWRFDPAMLDLRPDRDAFWREQQAERDAAVRDS
jgi:hypothetical protein